MVGAPISRASDDGGNGSSSILSQKRRRSSPSSGDGGGKRVDTEDQRLSTTLLDLNILDCPICYEALTIPIFQCDSNGHIACSSCCPRLSNKCPSCASPIGNNRCRAMESVLESIFVPCPNAAFGCTENVSYGKGSSHEKECIFSQCTCPVVGCDYTASFNRIVGHFWAHTSAVINSSAWFCYGLSFSVGMNIGDKMIMSVDGDGKHLFPVQCFREACGVYVTVSCIAPPSPKVGEFSYRLSYTVDGHTVIYESPEVKRILEVSFQTPRENFMLIPNSLLRGELLELKVCIKLKQVS